MPRRRKPEAKISALTKDTTNSDEPAYKKAKLTNNEDDFLQSNGNNSTVSLNFDDGDESDNEEAHLKINHDYARRFEYNKKREERQRLEEKYGKKKTKKKNDSDSDSSSIEDSDEETSEEEDEFGELITDDIDKDIEETINAIRRKDPRVYDPKAAFFKSIDREEGEYGTTVKEGKKEKPMYLTDYHRRNLLSGKLPSSEEENVDEGEKRQKPFFEEQDELKKQLVGAMHSAADESFKGKEKGDGSDDDDGDDSDFLQAKEVQAHEHLPEAPDPATADPDNPDLYLSNFMTSKAWLPKDRSVVYGPALESDDSELDELAETFEEAYNFRFEDPQNAPQILGHARQTLKQLSARRKEVSTRKRAREEKKRKKDIEKTEREREKGRLRALKIEETMEKVKKIKEAAGLTSNKEEDWKDWKKLLSRQFDVQKWEEEMQKKFNEDYYNQGGGTKIKKPKWDDDIDIKDLVPDFTDDNEKGGDDDGVGGNVSEEETGEENSHLEGGVDMADADSDADRLGSTKKSRKEYAKEQRVKKREERLTRSEVEKFIDENFDFDQQLDGAKKGFRYREVTPEAFGLSHLDILTAEDTQLNQYVGLKKYAPFRDKAKKLKDKKKYKKKRKLREWRKEVFGDEDGPETPPHSLNRDSTAADVEGERTNENANIDTADRAEEGQVDIKTGQRKRKRKRH